MDKNLIDKHNNYVNELIETHKPELMSDNDRWHFNRRLGIGGSDIGSILGLNKYKGMIQLWEEKRGICGSEEQSEPAYWGNVLESVVAGEFAKRNGVSLQVPSDHLSLASHPWATANVDRNIDEWGDILECKTTSAYSKEWGDDQSDEVPHSYYAQCQWYLMITKARKCHVALLQGGNKYRQFLVEPDEKIQQIMLKKATKFWFDNVIDNLMPEPKAIDISNNCFNDNGNSITADSHLIEKLSELNSIQGEINNLKEKKEKMIVDIKSAMGDHSIVLDDQNNKLASWKSSKQNRFSTSNFKKDYPDLYKQYLVQSEKRTFKI